MTSSGIKLTVGGLSSPGLQMALQKLNGAQVNNKVGYRFKKLNDSFEIEMKKVRDAYTKEVVEKFAKKDDKDKLIPAQVPWGFELKEGTVQEEFDKANEDFHAKEIVIDRNPLSLTDLNDVKISAAELSALGPFFIDPEEQESPHNVAHLPHGSRVDGMGKAL